jgi:2-iminobutanoate/2-iminopropanoate deaminase
LNDRRRLGYHPCMLNLAPRIAGFALILAVCATAADKKIVTPKDFPAGRPFSAGIMSGDTLYVSGQTGADFKTQKVPDNFDDEVRQCLNNIGSILQAGGMDFSNVVSVQVYMTDIDLFQRMNAVYLQVFKEPRPTRTTVGVAKLAGAGAHVEITVTARK